MKRLFEIQQKLKANKDLYNKFGGYSYRSTETILEALKPLLKEQNLCIIITDTLENIGDRYYVKATVKLIDFDGKLISETSAFAREEENKKGMDGSQITGASSSYARKYALNGMFAIDDAKDSDATNTHDKVNSKATSKPINEPKKENDIFITIEQKNELKKIMSGVDFAREFNECGGRMTIEKYEELKEKYNLQN